MTTKLQVNTQDFYFENLKTIMAKIEIWLTLR